MPFIGKLPDVGAFRLIDSITTSATDTYALQVEGLSYFPSSARNLIVSLNGVTQAPESAYTVSGSNIIFDSALTASDVIDYILVIGESVDIGTPSDNTVGNAQLKSDLDFSGKNLTFSADQISGDAINGGTISSFASTGIDDNATSTAITIDSDENVGIGITPSSTFGRLRVGDSNSDIDMDANAKGQFHIDGNAYGFGIALNTDGAQIYTNSSSRSIILGTDETERVRVNGSGDVGIGTVSPSTSLDVVRAGAQPLRLQSTSGTECQINMVNTGGNVQLEAHSGNFNIDADAVGIGTASPDNNLHIHTDGGDEGILIKSTGNTSNAIIADANRTSAGAAINNLQGKWNGTAVADMLFLTGSDTTNKDDGVIAFRTSSADNITERMRIDSNGRVGIGTSDPTDAGLVVDEKGEANTSASARFKSNEDTYLRIARFGTGSDSTITLGNNYNRNGGGFSADDSDYPTHNITFHTDGSIRFGNGAAGSTAPTERMRLGANGYLGINKTNPQRALDVYGGIRLSASGADANRWNVYWNSSTGDLILVSSDARLKKDFDYDIAGIETVNKLKPVRYTWKENNKRQLGFTAQESFEADGHLAWHDTENDRWGLDGWEGYAAVLTKAIQEQQAIIEDLQTRLSALEAN